MADIVLVQPFYIELVINYHIDYLYQSNEIHAAPHDVKIQDQVGKAPPQ